MTRPPGTAPTFPFPLTSTPPRPRPGSTPGLTPGASSRPWKNSAGASSRPPPRANAETWPSAWPGPRSCPAPPTTTACPPAGSASYRPGPARRGPPRPDHPRPATRRTLSARPGHPDLHRLRHPPRLRPRPVRPGHRRPDTTPPRLSRPGMDEDYAAIGLPPPSA